MYKIYKIRVKGTELYYQLMTRNWSHSQQEYAGTLQTGTFQKSKTYSKKGTAKAALNKLIKARAVSLGDMSDTLYDLPGVELVEFSVTEIVKKW